MVPEEYASSAFAFWGYREINAAAKKYIELGLDAIPLIAGQKIPFRTGWANLGAEYQWNNVPENVNIGIRCGGSFGLAVIDSDSPETAVAVRNYLYSIGLLPDEVPIVSTPSGGTHAYLCIENTPDGNRIQLKQGFFGDLRFGSRVQVVAPPSVTTFGEYTLVEGDFRQIPRVDFGNLVPILGLVKNRPSVQTIGSDTKSLPRLAERILNGDMVDYHSRSEAEAALCLSLINKGLAFDEVLGLCKRYPGVGKFKELWDEDPKNAIRYLRLTYDNETSFSINVSPGRETALRAISWSQSSSWPGRTGSSDRVTFEAHCKIAADSGRLTYAGASRRLAEIAGIHRKTAERATNRLIEAGLIFRVSDSKGDRAALYRVGTHPAPTSSQGIQGKWVYDEAKVNVFRRAGLGKSAGEVYDALLTRPMTKKELAVSTGRGVDTVGRAIERMTTIVDKTTGELLSLVESDGEVWKAMEVDFSHVAEVLGVSDSLNKQRARHARDRKVYQSHLDRKSGKGKK